LLTHTPEPPYRSSFRKVSLAERGLKILVIGGGGREHALVWKFRQSAAVDQVYCAPGNGGIQNDAECIPLALSDVKAAADIAGRLGADLTVVGPELPLVSGIADEFARRGLRILGPTQNAAQLEGSKVFAKKFMERHGIPTASVYGVFDTALDAYTALCAVDWPLVVKADGLCAGKGVLVTSSPDEATAFIDRVVDRREFGDAGRHVLLEEGLVGEELSYVILTDGKDFVPMPPTRDYKRAFDGNEGPNTGGMGAYSSDDILPRELESRIIETVVRPTLNGLATEGIPYCGFLYFGLILTTDGPKVLEFNCRLGDPETEAVVLRADFDFAAACLSAIKGNLNNVIAKWSPEAAVCVVMAAEGYPGTPKVGVPIEGIERAATAPEIVLFHAGTRRDGSLYYTSGGRVVTLAAAGESVRTARQLVYDAISILSIAGGHYRSDVGAEGRGLAAC
jgi:phosphoribosylamine---glycine ligase